MKSVGYYARSSVPDYASWNDSLLKIIIWEIALIRSIPTVIHMTKIALALIV